MTTTPSPDSLASNACIHSLAPIVRLIFLSKAREWFAHFRVIFNKAPIPRSRPDEPPQLSKVSRAWIIQNRHHLIAIDHEAVLVNFELEVLDIRAAKITLVRI